MHGAALRVPVRVSELVWAPLERGPCRGGGAGRLPRHNHLPGRFNMWQESLSGEGGGGAMQDFSGGGGGVAPGNSSIKACSSDPPPGLISGMFFFLLILSGKRLNKSVGFRKFKNSMVPNFRRL